MSKPTGKRKAITPQPKQWRMAGIVFACAFLLYSNTLSHDYALDDDIYTKKNTYVQQGFSALSHIFNKGSLHGFNGLNDSQYRPLTLLHFMAEVSAFGLNPHVSHFFNVLYYSITCLLVFLLLRKLLKAYPPYIPLLASLLFTFHPIHTEVVANIKSRDELMGFLFGLLCFYFLIRYAEASKTKHLFFSIFAFFFSTLCKETSLMFGFIAFFLLYFFSNWSLKKVFITSIPYAAVMLLYLLIRSNVMSNVTFGEKIVVMNNSLMAATNSMDMLATNTVMLGKYLWMLFFPYPLSWDYSYNQIPIVSWNNPKALLSLGVYFALGTWIILRFKKKDILVFSALFYLCTLFLTSNLVIKIGATFGERFLFAPSLGFCMALPVVLFRTFQNTSGQKTLLYVATVAILLFYSAIVIPRNKVWKNNLTLFESGIVSAPNSARTHLSVAIECRTLGENTQDPGQRMAFFGRSVEEFGKGLKIYNQDPEAYYNMGVTYFEMGDSENALKAYEKTLEMKPDYAMAWNNIGVIRFNKKEYTEALKYFKEALKLNPGYSEACVNMGAAYHNMGDYTNAISYYEKTIALKPNTRNAYDNLILIYTSMNDQKKVDYYTQLKKINCPK